MAAKKKPSSGKTLKGERRAPIGSPDGSLDQHPDPKGVSPLRRPQLVPAPPLPKRPAVLWLSIGLLLLWGAAMIYIALRVTAS